MHQIASALGDDARWRMVELLAERPRSVGELAELTGLRQPQTTKHLQTLARAGLVVVFPLAQRRVYAVELSALESFGDRLRQLAATAGAHAGDRDVLARYEAAIRSETARADRRHWADGRTFAFDRSLSAPREVVWRHWVDPELLASWWAPTSFSVTRCALVPRRGGRVLLEYRDADGRAYLSEGRVRAAKKPEHLEFDLSVLDEDGGVAFTGRHDLSLADDRDGTRLHLELTLTDTTVEAVAAIAGIETGWGQVLDQLADAVSRRTSPARSKKTNRKDEPS